MKYLLKQATIVTPEGCSPKKDILIINGKIQKVARQIQEDVPVISSPDLHVSIGWFDIGTKLDEPGFEEHETAQTLQKALVKGGYTGFAPFPNTFPVADKRVSIQSIKHLFDSNNLDVYPIGAVSEGIKGVDLAEMEDMLEGGAIAFSDGIYAIQDSGLMYRALQYAQRRNTLVLNSPIDRVLCQSAPMHEGEISTSLGLPGDPFISETLMVQRDITLAKYVNAKHCLHNISSEKSLKILKQADRTLTFCSVSSMHLLHSDSTIEAFNPVFKTEPVLRTEDDRLALMKAVLKHKINYISSNHRPIAKEQKDLEYVRSSVGASTIETVFSSLWTFAKKYLSLECIIDKLAYGPREVLGIDIPLIEVNSKANLTLFDPSITWEVQSKNLASKSKNNPYLGQTLDGVILGTICNKKYNKN